MDKFRKLDKLIMRKAKVMKMTGLMDMDKLVEEIDHGMKKLDISNDELMDPKNKFKFRKLIMGAHKGLVKEREKKEKED